MKNTNQYSINNTTYKILEDINHKTCIGKDYCYYFNKNTGYFMRWGETKSIDPKFSPIGPEILDLEITTECEGNCKFCYKANNHFGKNMPFETFKKIIDLMPATLTQIAFGVDSQAKSNSDLFKMMDYCKQQGIIPNTTVSNIADINTAKNLARYCGAISVSRYADKNICYDTVDLLLEKKAKQVNIHLLLSEETFDNCVETIEDLTYPSDPRLENLNSVVFLTLKQKGRGINFHSLSQQKYNYLIKLAKDSGINFGADSCSANNILNTYKKGTPEYDNVKMLIEPCESGLFSYYINVDGLGYPCSFTENIIEPIDITLCNDFLKDVWYNKITLQWRLDLLNICRKCPIYKI